MTINWSLGPLVKALLFVAAMMAGMGCLKCLNVVVVRPGRGHE